MTILMETNVVVSLTGKEMKEVKKMVTGHKAKDLMDILLNLRFTIKDGLLTVELVHNNYELVKKFPVNNGNEGSFLVPIDFIKKMKGIKNGDTFTFKLLDENKLEIATNGSKRVLNTLNVESFPEISITNREHIGIIEYEEALKIYRALTSTSTTEARPILQHVLIREGRVYSTDSHRLYGSDINLNHDEDIILTFEGIRYLKSLFNKKERIEVSLINRAVCFSQSNTEVVIKKFEGIYPKLNRIIPDKLDAKTSFVVEDKQVLIDLVKEAGTVSANKKNNVIKFDIKKDKLIITSKNPEIGEFSATMDINLDGEEMEISMNSKYMLEGLSQLESDVIELHFFGSLRPFTIQPLAKEDELVLILPVRTY